MPAYTVGFLPAAVDDLDDIADPLYRRVRTAVAALAGEPRPAGAIKLAGSRNLYRIRVGQYRIVYEVQDKTLAVLIVGVAPRDKIYSLIKRR